jgi:glycine/D-amino acid oxidase-like deaminating enzyme
MLGRNELTKYLPDIGPEVVGASWCEFDGHVNSLRLFRAFHEGFLAYGGRYVPNRPVESITRVGGLYEIRSNQQVARAEKIVLAAGNANATLAPMVGLHAPMKPERGQIVVTERVRPFLLSHDWRQSRGRH